MSSARPGVGIVIISDPKMMKAQMLDFLGIETVLRNTFEAKNLGQTAPVLQFQFLEMAGRRRS